jgi:hypothetical protein
MLNRLGVTFGMALLGLAVVLPPAWAAKDCRKLCHDTIKACVEQAKTANDCKGLTGADRRTCRKARRHAIMECGSSKGSILTACKASTNPNTCS